MGRKEDSRSLVNKSALYAAGLGLLPVRFSAPAVAALGARLLSDVREVYGAEVSPVEQIVAAAVLGSGQFGLAQVTRAARVVPWVGPAVSAVVTGLSFKALGESAIAYYQWARHVSEVDAQESHRTDDAQHRVSF